MPNPSEVTRQDEGATKPKRKAGRKKSAATLKAEKLQRELDEAKAKLAALEAKDAGEPTSEVNPTPESEAKQEIIYYCDKAGMIIDLKAPTKFMNGRGIWEDNNDGITLIAQDHFIRIKPDDAQYDEKIKLLEASKPYKNQFIQRQADMNPTLDAEARALDMLDQMDESAIRMLFSSEDIAAVGLPNKPTKSQMKIAYIKLGKHNQEYIMKGNAAPAVAGTKILTEAPAVEPTPQFG